MPSTPTGIRNKNYLNVKNTSSPWADAGGRPSKTDERGHAVFTDPAYGIRAGILQLRAYFFKHNRRTVAEILSRWAPATDTVGSLPGAPPNSPAAYSTFVSGRMGISFNQRLDIFNEDKSIGNIARLRALFYAMAEYENGNGFRVPDEEFNAGLDLVQPGITIEGTSDANHTSAAAVITGGNANGSSNGGPKWRIGGSVGRWDRGAVNAKADVELVQEMLRHVALILREPRLDPGGIDGEIARSVTKSATVKAIEAFQGRFFPVADGLIEVGGRTWRELLGIVTGGAPGEVEPEEPQNGQSFFFPLERLPTANWTGAPRSFGSRRSKGTRAHAGCDLYAPAGTSVHAITDGTVIRGPEPFYAGTYAIEIDHGTFLARYGEVDRGALVRKGDPSRPVKRLPRSVVSRALACRAICCTSNSTTRAPTAI
jgi:murein DD-endopeptidase MepM/ murein hydrolase activator NlpD